jgi:hypothetical protein
VKVSIAPLFVRLKAVTVFTVYGAPDRDPDHAELADREEAAGRRRRPQHR